MDEAQVQALIDKALEGFQGTVTATVTEAVKPIKEALEAKPPKATKPAKETRTDEAEESPLAKTVKDLQARLEAKEASEAKQALEAAIDAQIDRYDLRVTRSTAKKLLLAEYGSAEATEAGYVLKDGLLLDKAIEGFFGTDDGKALLKPRRQVQGSEVEPGRSSAPSGTKGMPDLTQVEF